MFKYRLYPNKVQESRLVSACIELKGAYNKLLEDSIAEYKANALLPARYLCPLLLV
jgi:hypothetical protein